MPDDPPPMETETLFLLDRNAVSLIKDAIADREPPNAKKQADLETLRALDVPQHSISALLSHHGRGAG
jgi:hypothetical protein